MKFYYFNEKLAGRKLDQRAAETMFDLMLEASRAHIKFISEPTKENLDNFEKKYREFWYSKAYDEYGVTHINVRYDYLEEYLPQVKKRFDKIIKRKRYSSYLDELMDFYIAQKERIDIASFFGNKEEFKDCFKWKETNGELQFQQILDSVGENTQETQREQTIVENAEILSDQEEDERQ